MDNYERDVAVHDRASGGTTRRVQINGASRAPRTTDSTCSFDFDCD